jgi:hypothetical protein
MRDQKSEETGCRHEASHTFHVQGHIDQVFGLFDPVSERDWVDDWDPEPVFPEELSRATGTVFILQRDGRTAVWTILRHDPAQHVAEYLVAEPEYLHRWIHVSCSATDDSHTSVTVRYVTTALSDEGRQDLRRYGKEFLLAWKDPVQEAINNLGA